MNRTNCRYRLEHLKRELQARRLDSFLVTNETNISYLSGFPGHDAVILATRGKQFFITDSRYIEDARDKIKGFEIELVKGSTYKTIESLTKKCRLKKMGFEGMNLPYEVAVRLKVILGRSRLMPTKSLVENIRIIKDDGELSLVRDSISVAKVVLNKMMSSIRPGCTEVSLAKMAEAEFIKNGARPGFDPIIAAGSNSSKPHAKPGRRAINKDSFVMIDIGCNLNGYNSDITRMLFLGKVKDRIRKIYAIAQKAQILAIEKIRPGVRIAEIDAAARGYIRSHGFGKYFGHSLGHGVGMDVHEEPTVSGNNEAPLSAGMVFTVEPAIYLPKIGGVRVEDMVLVTDKGCEVLTR